MPDYRRLHVLQPTQPWSGLRLTVSGKMKWCPRCGRDYFPCVDHCSDCEQPPEPVDEEDSLPGPRRPPMDQYDDDFREEDYDGGLGDYASPFRCFGGRRA